MTGRSWRFQWKEVGRWLGYTTRNAGLCSLVSNRQEARSSSSTASAVDTMRCAINGSVVPIASS